MQAKEVKQFLAEKAERDEAYYNEAINSGFDDIHYYENYITRVLINRVVVVVLLAAIIITGLIYLLI